MSAEILLTGSLNSGGTLPILGLGTITFSGNTHTATAADYQDQDLTLAGTLTATGTLTMPNNKGWLWYIYNGTTGGFSVNVTAGTSGIAIAHNTGALVRCDGAGNITAVGSVAATGGTHVDVYISNLSTDWTAAFTTIALYESNTIHFSNPLTGTIPAGSYDPGISSKWSGVVSGLSGDTVSLVIPTGVAIVNNIPEDISGIQIEFTSTTAAGFTVNTGNTVLCNLRNGSTFSSAAGSATSFPCVNYTNSTSLTVGLYDLSELFATQSNKTLFDSTDSSFASVSVNMFDSSSINAASQGDISGVNGEVDINVYSPGCLYPTSATVDSSIIYYSAVPVIVTSMNSAASFDVLPGVTLFTGSPSSPSVNIYLTDSGPTGQLFRLDFSSATMSSVTSLTFHYNGQSATSLTPTASIVYDAWGDSAYSHLHVLPLGSAASANTESTFYTNQSSPVTMTNGILAYRTSSVTNNVSFNLPASASDGEVHELSDIGGNVASSHTTPKTITLSGNGNNIVNPVTGTLVSSVVFTRDYQTVRVRWCSVSGFWQAI